MARTLVLSIGNFCMDSQELPTYAGIYFVYLAKFFEKKREYDPRELLYIGETHNIRSRVHDHGRRPDWESHLKVGYTLCYSCAQSSITVDRKRAEAALIFKHQPPENIQHKNNFGYPETTIFLYGDFDYLSDAFTVSGYAVR